MAATLVTPWIKIIALRGSRALARYTRAKVSVRLETPADRSPLRSAITMTGANAANLSSASSEEVIVPVNLRSLGGTTGTLRIASLGLTADGFADRSDGRT